MRRGVKRAAVLAAVSVLGLAACEKQQASEQSAEAAAPAAEAVVLRPAFRTGESMTYEFMETTVQTQESPLHSVRRDVHEARVIELRVQDAEPGGVATLGFRFLKITTVLADNGSVTYQYDSDATTEDLSAPTRARDLMMQLDATLTVGPGGTVLSMQANLTAEQVETLPAPMRLLLAENWYRGVVAQIFQPVSRDRALRPNMTWTETAEADGAAIAAESGRFTAVYETLALDDDAATLRVQTLLERDGQNVSGQQYLDVRGYAWDRRAGNLRESEHRQRVRLSREISGTEGSESLDRQIVLRRVNPPGPIDDIETSLR